LSLVILLSALVGIVLTSMLGAVRHWKLRSRIRQLENQLARIPAPASSASQSVTQEPPF
jgi:hypothetical protein